MDNMEEKLGAILNNPEMMGKIMALAQGLNQEQPNSEASQVSGIDPGMLRALAGMAKGQGIDENQRSLLKALSPYINRERIAKLENAMRAARLAQTASRFLGSGGIRMLTGR